MLAIPEASKLSRVPINRVIAERLRTFAPLPASKSLDPTPEAFLAFVSTRLRVNPLTFQQPKIRAKRMESTS
jgi:hypothetical protein